MISKGLLGCFRWTKVSLLWVHQGPRLALQGNLHLPLALPLWIWCPWSLQRFANFLSPLGLRTAHWTVGRHRPSLWSLPCLLSLTACSHRWLQSLFIQMHVMTGDKLGFAALKLTHCSLPVPSYLQKAKSAHWAHLTVLSFQPHCGRARQWFDPRKYLKSNLKHKQHQSGAKKGGFTSLCSLSKARQVQKYKN